MENRGLLFAGTWQRPLFISVLLLVSATTVLSQSVSINNSGAAPDPMSILDLQSTTQGALLPRLTSGQIAAILPLGSIPTGLTVYNTTTNLYNYWDGSSWQVISSASGNTLDEAYDEGGAGAGKVIMADAGAVDIQGAGGLLVNGITGIGTNSPDANYALSVLKNTNNSVKIAGASLGLLVEVNASGEDGISSIQSSTANSSNYYAVRGEVTNEAGIGYLGYHTSGDRSYGVFGKSGTFAGYFEGNTNVATGNVGIGITTAATERLQVAGGNIYLSSASSKLMASTAFDITGQSGIDIIIDDDDNSTNASFRVQKDLGTTLFELQEDGDIFFSGFNTGGTGNQLLQADINNGEVTLSSIDLSTLVSGTGAPTQVAYFDALHNIVSEANLFWNPSLDRLGIGTSLPQAGLHINNAASEGIRVQSTGAESDIHYINDNTTWQVGTNNSGNGTNGNQFYFNDGSYRLTVQKGTGFIGVGTAAPGVPLHVKANRTGTDGQLLVEPLGANTQSAAIVVRGARDTQVSNNPSGIRFENYDLGSPGPATTHTMGSIESVLTNATTNVGDLVFYTSDDGDISSLSETVRLTKDGDVKIAALVGGGTEMVVADVTGTLSKTTVPAGTITGVTAGTGLTGGGTTGTITVNAVGDNGLTTNADDIDLGGALNQNTTIAQGGHTMDFTTNNTLVDAFSIDGTTFSVDALNNRIGIGTAAPDATLHAINTGTGTQQDLAHFFAPNMSATDALYLKLGKAIGGTGNSADIVFNWQGNNSTANYLGFGFYNTGLAMTVTAAGNVGVGYNFASPSANFHIKTTGSTLMPMRLDAPGEAYSMGSSSRYTYYNRGTVMAIAGTANSVNSGALIDFNAYNSTNGATGAFIGAVAGATGNGPANFVIGRRTGTTSWAESARFDVDGDLGIGTTNPLEKLHVRNGKAYINKNNNDPQTANYANADLVLGDNVTNRSGYTGGTGSHIFLQSSDKSSITALDESNDLGQISYQNLRWTLGEDVGWGNQTIRIPSLDQNANRLVMVDANGDLYASASLSGSGLGDNLGNHIATTTLNMNGNSVNNASSYRVNHGSGTVLEVGDDAWIYDVNAANTVGIIGNQNATHGSIRLGTNTSAYLYSNGTANLGVGTTAPDAPFTVGDGTNANAYVHVKRNNNPHINLFEGSTSVARMQGDIVSGHNQFQITSANGATSMFNVNQDDGKVGLGTTTPGSSPLPSARLEINDQDGSNSDIQMKVAGNGWPTIAWVASGGTLGSPSAVTNGNITGGIVNYTHNGTAYGENAKILFVADGAPSNGNNPGRIAFETTTAGSALSSTKMQLNNAGALSLTVLAGGGTQNLQVDNNGTLIVGTGSLPGDNLGNHTATTNLNMDNREIDNITYLDITPGNGYGMRFWSDNQYKIHMGDAAENHYGNVTSYSIKNNMSNNAGRGFTWGVSGLTPTASIEATTGNMTLKGNLHVSQGNTTGNGIILADDGGIYDRNDGYATLAFSNGVDFEDAQDANDHLTLTFNNGYPQIASYLNGSATLTEFTTGMYNNGGTFYSQNQIFSRTGIANDGGTLLLNDDVRISSLGAGAVISDASGNLSVTPYSTFGDNLGNHIATTGIQPIAGGIGINWADNAFGGGGDDAYIQYYSEGGENTKLRILTANDADDDIEFYQYGAARMRIESGEVLTLGTLRNSGNFHNSGEIYNNGWYRGGTADNNYVKLYGNSRQMVFRTDGTLEYSGQGSYPFVWTYGGDGSANRRMILDNSGNIWTNTYGWLHTYIANAVAAGPGADNLGNHTATTNLTMASNAITFNNTGGNGIQWGAGPYSRIYENGQLYIQTDDNMYFTNMSGTNRMHLNTTNGDLSLNGKHAFRTNDSYLRLNQDNAFTSGTYTPYLMRADGGYQVDGNQVIDADGGWHRSYGNTGWYSETHGGGWYMTDGTWVRAYNGKSIWTSQWSQADAGMNAAVFNFGQWNNGLPTFYDGQMYRTGGQAECRVDDWFYFRDNDNNIREYVNTDNGNYYAYGYSNISDRRLKENIETIKTPIALLNRLRGVNYDFIEGTFGTDTLNPASASEIGKNKFGFIAQEVQKVMPSAVHTVGAEGLLLSVEYDAVIPVLVEAVKEQQAIIESLQESNLNKRVEALEVLVKQLLEERK